eukprot:TRINITY_DN2141_c0_g1_i2.p1 TRINITY_DN2141_c0_g1~~TRINITY_DN2141_c0_g1_i2.p1  ORF type:complete len:286 (-),score=56.21 TRINITY_DN2141_c0_g1_i2:49-906(-)
MGYYHSIILTDKGEVVTIPSFQEGYNYTGNEKEKELVDFNGYSLSLSFLSGKEIVISVTCGCFHSLLITSEGRAYGWGSSTSYELNDETTSVKTPLEIKGDLQNKFVTQIGAGYNNSVFLVEGGQVYARGSGNLGKKVEKRSLSLCDGDERILQKVESISCFNNTVHFLTEGRTLVLFFEKTKVNEIKLASPLLCGTTGYNNKSFFCEKDHFVSSLSNTDFNPPLTVVGINEKYPFYSQEWKPETHRLMRSYVKKAIFCLVVLRKIHPLFKRVPKPVLYIIFRML